jgi:hypothetical protein
MNLICGDAQASVELRKSLGDFFTQRFPRLEHSQTFGQHIAFVQKATLGSHTLNERDHVAWDFSRHVNLMSIEFAVGRPRAWTQSR